LFADHWDDLASWTRLEWNVMLENTDQLEARLEELARSPELSEADRSWAADTLDKARAMREHKREAKDL
jgi:ribosome assembly protein YihI (activator of Der GTPase)